ncbi:MAG: CBS domain-containing protein [Burkholderiales bacterium]|nr:CBS domain-containing protein [Burkholderiales bacterium]
MRAGDVMTTNVVSVGPQTSVRDIARTLLEHRISAVPVIDDAQRIVGIVSEGDLMRRSETETGRPASWWLLLLSSPETRAEEYVKAHGRRAEEVMTNTVHTVGEDTTLEEVADILERRRIKRVPVVRDGKIAGIVSRANLLRGLVAAKVEVKTTVEDQTIRKAIMKSLEREAGVRDEFVNVIVSNGLVHLWGALFSEAERHATRLVVENTKGVRKIEDHLSVLPPEALSTLWS